jgi:hypothetical protein
VRISRWREGENFPSVSTTMTEEDVQSVGSQGHAELALPHVRRPNHLSDHTKSDATTKCRIKRLQTRGKGAQEISFVLEQPDSLHQ